MSKFIIRIIQQLKKYQTETLNAADFLYMVNLLITNESHPLKRLQQFIQHNYSHKQIEWKDIEDGILEQMYLDELKFAQKHSINEKKQSTKEQQLINDHITDKNQIETILKEKNITRDQLINNYIEEINKNKILLTKINSNKKKQSKDNKSHETNQRKIYENKIQSLQKIINTIKIQKQIDSEHHTKSPSLEENQKFKEREEKLKFIAQKFEFKKQYFEDLQQSSQLEQFNQLQRKVSEHRKLFKQRLKQLFLHYSNQNYDPALSFEKNNQKLTQIDLRLFLKYFKELKDAFQGLSYFNDDKTEKRFKSNNLTLIFKRHGSNKREINFSQFLSIHQELLFGQNEQNQFSSMEQMNGEIKDRFGEKHTQAEALKEQLLKLNNIKNIFLNEKISKILNISEKSRNFQDSSRLNQENLYKTSISEFSHIFDKNIKNGLQKHIDQSLAAYEETKNSIHKNLMKKNEREKIGRSNQRSNGSEIMKEKKLNKEDSKFFSRSQKFLKNSIGKISNKIYSNNEQGKNIRINRNSQTSPVSNNKLEQIIKQVEEQEEEGKRGLLRYKKSKSLGNFQASEPKIYKKSTFKKVSSVQYASQSTAVLKNVFTLPRITRLSQERIENQSIVKTLNYLYQAMGKQEEPRIKKILQLDNPESNKANAEQNKFLKEYFNKQGILQNQKQKEVEQTKRKAEQHKKCKKFKEQNYEKFMKFS